MNRRQTLGMLVVAGWASTLTLLGQEGNDAIRRDAVVRAVERVMPCVVNIATEQIVEYSDPFAGLFQEFWGPYYRRRPRETRYSLGSGVIINKKGYVLTNMHVVQRASRVWVQLHDGREFEARPKIIATPRTDVALLQLLSEPGEEFPEISLAHDEDLLLGETVLALGNPFGLGGSVSRGILSSKNRRPRLEDEPADVADWLQTDAAINPGSSGGPLINLNGEMIGLNVAVHREGNGIGFAIPIKLVASAFSEIYIPEVNHSLWFGARLRTGPYPLTVTGVQAASPAEEADLRIGDRMVEVNGRRPEGFMDCTDLIGTSPGGVVRLEIERDGKRMTVQVQLKPLQDLVRQRVGLTLQELTPELAESLGYAQGEGLLIADVEQQGPAAAVDLRPGLLVTHLGGQPAQDLLSAAAVLTAIESGSAVEVTVAFWRQRGAFPPRLVQGKAVLKVR